MTDLPLGWAGLVGAVVLLIHALGAAVPKISAAIVDALKAKSENDAKRASAEVIREKTELAEAETTGRFVASQEKRIESLERQLGEALAEIAAYRAKLAERDAAIGALVSEVRQLRLDMMAGAVAALLTDMTKAARALVTAFRADPQRVEPAIAELEETLTKAERLVR